MEKWLKITWLMAIVAIILVGTLVYVHCGWGRTIGSTLSIFFIACAVNCYISSFDVESETDFNRHCDAIAFCLFLFLCAFIPTIS